MEKNFIKDFSKANYRNPKKLRNQRKKRKKILFFSAIFFILLVISILIILFFTPYFRIQKINISGLNTIKENSIREIIDQELSRGRLIKHNNIFVFNANSVKKAISKAYLLEWINIKKQTYPPKIDIQLEEKVSALTYLTDENCFNIDIQGLIVEKCNELSVGFIQIRDQSGAVKNIGDQVLGKENINYIIELDEQLKSQGIGIRTFKIPDETSSDLRVLTQKGYEIYFNRNLSINEQLVRFNMLVKNEIKPENLNKISYVDLRFGEKIFYK